VYTFTAITLVQSIYPMGSDIFLIG